MIAVEQFASLEPPLAAPSVRVAVDADATTWSGFVDAHPNATIFHAWAWRGLLHEVFAHEPHYLIAERESAVVGVLPLAEVRSHLFGSALVSLPFGSYCGPLGFDREVESALLEHAREIAQARRVGHLEIRDLGDRDRGMPRQDLYVAFMREIGADHDANLTAIPRKQRAMVRKGIREGLVSTVDDADAFYPLYVDNVHRHGTPGCPKRFFTAMQDAFGSACQVLVVRDAAGEALSAVLSLIHRDEVFPFYAGDVPRARAVAANDFKYWEVMRRAADAGLRRFNYGRSKRGTGSFDFKRNWGFEPTPLSYHYHLVGRDSIPENNPLNPKYRLMIETWRRMPRWFVEWLGPHLVRALG